MSLRRPSGTPAPTVAALGDDQLDLRVLADQVCERYHGHYTDEQERYGDAGREWCRHDNQWLISWAVGDVLGVIDLDEQASWLARVLHAREFPIDRLVHNLRIAADVVSEHVVSEQGTATGAALRRAAGTVDSLHFEPARRSRPRAP